ncbi:MAG TPA: hypothetical protein VFX67_01115 [Burkholderiales bacterium]|nr:hypothetical protein [Burkholderiales bacterium]
MRRILIPVLAASFGLVGSATLAAAGLFSATGPVIAILAEDLFVGEAEADLSGAGTLAIRSQKSPRLTCTGEFTSSAVLGGSGQMRCSDGATATFRFQRLGIYRGYGTGHFSRGSMSFAYGFGAEKAAPYLRLPEGKKLSHNGMELALVDR